MFRCEIPVQGTSVDVLEYLTAFACTFTIEITTDNADVLLTAARTLGIDQVREACIDFLSSQLCAENAFTTFQLAQKLDCLRLEKNVDYYIGQNFDEVAATDNFLNASPDYVKALTRRTDLKVSSEGKVFEFVMKWAKKMPTQRNGHLPEILREVRAKLLCPRSSPECDDLEEISIPRRVSVDENDSLDEEETLTASQKCTKSFSETERNSSNESTPTGLYLITEESCLVMQHFDPEKGTWATTKNSPQVMLTGTATEMNGTLYFVDRGVLRAYDSSSKTWRPKFGLFPPRLCVRAATLNNMLYLCSRTDDDATRTVLERLNVEDSKYSLMSCSLGPRNLCDIVALGESLYIIGGKYGFEQVSNSVSKYNPESSQWIKMSPMLTARWRFGCTAMDGKIYVCGGMKSNDENDTLASAEVYDPEANEWKYIPSMQTDRRDCVLLSHCGKIYAIGGNSAQGIQELITMEVYDPIKEKWEYGTPINHFYSCLTGASISTSHC